MFVTLNAPRSDAFLRDIYNLSLLGEILPEIQGWEHLEISPGISLWEHALKVVGAAEFVLLHSADLFGKSLEVHFAETIEEGISRRALFKFLALLHDSGKPPTQASLPGKAPFRFLDHDQEGEKVNARIGQRLRLSRKSSRILSQLTRQHMRLQSLSKAKGLTGRAKYRFFKDLGREGMDILGLALANALAKRDLDFSRGEVENFPEDIHSLRQIGMELLHYYTEEFTRKDPGPLLSGKEIMQVLHLPEGKEVGRLTRRLHEAELSGIVRTRAEAFEYLRSEYQKNIDKFSNVG